MLTSGIGKPEVNKYSQNLRVVYHRIGGHMFDDKLILLFFRHYYHLSAQVIRRSFLDVVASEILRQVRIKCTYLHIGNGHLSRISVILHVPSYTSRFIRYTSSHNDMLHCFTSKFIRYLSDNERNLCNERHQLLLDLQIIEIICQCYCRHSSC